METTHLRRSCGGALDDQVLNNKSLITALSEGIRCLDSDINLHVGTNNMPDAILAGGHHQLLV